MPTGREAGLGARAARHPHGDQQQELLAPVEDAGDANRDDERMA